ncbi:MULTISPECIES: hypothetical protein [Rhizobium]|uniref:Cell envelope biogenesis protein OmpA n=1 Tax=Rhizobium tropici TaxID=398 RepID=A0ABR6R4Q4_RHITR|nr:MULTISPECIES: hypothetical protein [Rhizobium]AGB71936.1 hypothetical protein RTCIAT899_CH12785 [Rhizobium tropici CIAT 899]MBB4243832.1 hypothetical protein [Rhizobium tropici]MBB5593193.1 hypothetical protein [Rhizobium tropici]MBB6494172.1 hypothetical protein [Rhizobium tropici]
MFQTAFTLSLTQFARTLSLPERLQHSPARNLALEGLRQRNLALDALFYDVKSITPEEAFYISDSLAAEGAIMLIPPSGLGALTLCETIDEFVLRGGGDARALAVAGIGGSALGAAAFARNVADAIDAPVAVVVSGYGIADVITEALGGSFFFGHLRDLRPLLESLDDLAGRPKVGAQSDGTAARTSLDTRTVQALLADPRLSFRLLTGHSKGNLVLSAALHNLSKQDEGRVAELARHTKIVTIGTRIAMPPVFRDVVDVMGEWDWFGEINSRAFIHADRRVAQAWHHTNTDLGGHLPVTTTLREILAASPIAESPKTAEHQDETLGAISKPAMPNTEAPSPLVQDGRQKARVETVQKAFPVNIAAGTQPAGFGASDDVQSTKPH